jgi:hypothetical protein
MTCQSSVRWEELAMAITFSATSGRLSAAQCITPAINDTNECSCDKGNVNGSKRITIGFELFKEGFHVFLVGQIELL